MDPILNPYTPGAGTPPHALAGRAEVRETVRVAVGRTKVLNPSKSVIMVGLRGVGKTVLLDQMREDAESIGVYTIRIEAPEKRSLPAILAPELRVTLIELSRVEKAKELANKAMRGLAGFVSAMKLKFDDIEIGMDINPGRGLADNGDLERDLQALFQLVGETAKAADTAVAIFIDELHYVPKAQLAALITALHRCSQRRFPLILIGAGLPQLLGQMGEAKSYAERLFEFPTIGALDQEQSRLAIELPAKDHEVDFEEKALDLIYERTEGYPYFLQEW